LIEKGTMSILSFMKRSVLALAFTLSLLAAAPAQAQGDGPLSTCLEQSGRRAAAFEACLIERQQEFRNLCDLPADWTQQVHAYIETHPQAWDRLEDLADGLENRCDRAADARDRREDRLDRREDVRDRREDRRDRREDVCDRLENRQDRRH
jgi:hypothetical protein